MSEMTAGDVLHASAAMLSDLQSRLRRLAAERDAALEELAIWKSVFPDIAPERVLPDRSKVEAELTAALAREAVLREAVMAAKGCLDDPTGGTHIADMRAASSVLRSALATPSPAADAVREVIEAARALETAHGKLDFADDAWALPGWQVLRAALARLGRLG